ncbi:MAG: Gam-like protein [Bacteriophage sp.]|nr:MAG: Gam-like protein [Bacteriophage sp.]
MDMNMFDAEETESAPRPAWRITDDGCADWACRKIAEEKTELDRITALGESQIEKIRQRIDAAQRRYENGTRFLTGKLAEYFETVPHKTTKTKHSYRLLSGTLVKKLGGSTMKQDDDTLLAYLKASGNEDMIQNTEKPKWSEFKKRLEIVGGQIVDKTTGELVEGVQIIEKPDTFTVDV